MTQSPNRFSTSRSIALAALLTALALIFSYVESLVPLGIAIPGVKLGIANLVIIVALYMLDFKYAFTINVLRIVLAGLLFSGVFGMLYSLAGGLLSLIVMGLLKRTGRFSIIGISIAGGFMHNLGQIFTAALVMGTSKIFLYFPVLIFSGIITGTIIGIVAYIILHRLSPSSVKLDKVQ